MISTRHSPSCNDIGESLSLLVSCPSPRILFPKCSQVEDDTCWKQMFPTTKHILAPSSEGTCHGRHPHLVSAYCGYCVNLSWNKLSHRGHDFLSANIEIGQPSKSTLGGSWKWCSERTRPSCPRRGKDNCGFQSKIKIFSPFSKNFWKINLQIFVRFARKDVFSFDCDIFGQHVAGGNIYLCPRALILLN